MQGRFSKLVWCLKKKLAVYYPNRNLGKYINDYFKQCKFFLYLFTHLVKPLVLVCCSSCISYRAVMGVYTVTYCNLCSSAEVCNLVSSAQYPRQFVAFLQLNFRCPCVLRPFYEASILPKQAVYQALSLYSFTASNVMSYVRLLYSKLLGWLLLFICLPVLSS